MANLQNTRDSNETSVVFNLRDLMRIEAERIAAEEAAARAAAGRAAQARADRERAARDEAEREALAARTREREAQEAEHARAAQREAMLLRVRSESAARERAESQRLALEHERALHAMQIETRRSRFTRALVGLLSLIAIGGAAHYAIVVQPALRSARERAHAAAAAQAQQAQALQAALAQLAQERSLPRAAATAVSPARALASNTAPNVAPASAIAHVVRTPKAARKPAPAPAHVGLDPIGDDGSDGNLDPLYGLPGVEGRKSRGPR